MRPLFAATLAVLSAALVFAAPVPKDKNKEEPATDEQRKQVQDTLKLIGIALHSYSDTNLVWPSDVLNAKKTPLLSWRVLLLPYLEEQKLFSEFKLDEPWDSEANKKLIAKIPKVYAPVRVKAEEGETFYRGFGGTDPMWAGAFRAGGKLRMPASFPDGTSNTIAVIDAGEPVVWTKPDTDPPVDPKKPLPKLGRMTDGNFYCLLCDGSVRAVKREFDEKEMRRFIGLMDAELMDDAKVFDK